MRWLAAWLLLAPGLALGQGLPAGGLPEGLQGSWVQGDCASPVALLQVTARAAARVPVAGHGRLLRFTGLREAAGWSLGTAGGAAAPRLLLRPAGEALETAEPEAKLRDGLLPGTAAVIRWQRCAAVPAALAAQHGEGFALLAALEHLEAACAGDAATCLGALVAQADVSGDGQLGSAELARLARGLGWVVALQEGASVETLGAATGAAGLAGVLAARLLVESLDYDGNGRLSAAELGQDRLALGAARGSAAGRPLDGALAGQGLDALRGLLSGLGLR